MRGQRAAVSIPLAVLEDIIDTSRVAAAIEALLPAGVRHRQLPVRTLLTGMMLTLDDRRPAYLTEVHAALTALPAPDQARLGVTETWKTGPHQLTYRQVEHTFRLAVKALSKKHPDGAPSDALAGICDDLLEAGIPAEHKDTSAALSADWTDVETWSRPPPHGTTGCADPEAHRGHRNTNLPGPKGEMFFGYYLSAATMTREETGPAVPELARRMTLTSCEPDPVRAFAKVLTRMPAAASRSATSWPTPGTPTAPPPPGPSRSARPALSSSRTCTRTTAARREPTTARSSPTGTCTAPPRQRHCWNSARWAAPPPSSRPQRTTRRQPS
jgi:hypothetical protein